MPTLLALLALVGGDPQGTREARVLALLQEAARTGSYRYSQASFEEIPARLGDGPVVIARIDTPCANSDTGSFDDVAARRIALECLRIFGLAVEREQRILGPGCSVQLDGVDLAARIGFELVGRGCRETFCEVQAEEPELALEAAEAGWLAEQGLALHVADVADYRGAGDEFTPTLAYVAGLVRFLNAVTEGEDVILDGLLFARERAWELPVASLDGARPGPYGGSLFVVEEARTLRLSCAGAPEFMDAPARDPWGFYSTHDEAQARRGLASTLGAASVLLLHGEALGLTPGDPAPGLCVRLRQTLGGVERVQEGAALALFLARDFDLARPFELELELSPGRLVLYGPARIGGAAPDPTRADFRADAGAR